MSLTIDTDTLHRWALDNGYVRLADITEFVRHQSAPDPQQVLHLMGGVTFANFGGPRLESTYEVAHAAIDTAAELNDKTDDLFVLVPPTSGDVLNALRDLFDSKGDSVSRDLLSKFGAKKAGDIPAEKALDFITEAKRLT